MQVATPEEEHDHVTLKNYGPTDDDQEDWALDSNSDTDKDEGENGLPRDPSLLAAKKAEGAPDAGAAEAGASPSKAPKDKAPLDSQAEAPSDSQAASDAPPSSKAEQS